MKESPKNPNSKWKYISQPLPKWVRGTMRERFSKIYRRRFWEDGESVSGPGSSLKQAGVLIDELPRVWRRLGVKKALDAPCGDFNWMRAVNLGGFEYVGVDIVAELIEENQRRYGAERTGFLCLDFVRDPLPTADVILCRDGLVHLCFEDIRKALANFARSGSNYLMATSFPRLEANLDIETGDWRPLNLQKPPFELPLPLDLLSENCPEIGYEDKSLGIWKLAELGW